MATFTDEARTGLWAMTLAQMRWGLRRVTLLYTTSARDCSNWEAVTITVVRSGACSPGQGRKNKKEGEI